MSNDPHISHTKMLFRGLPAALQRALKSAICVLKPTMSDS